MRHWIESAGRGVVARHPFAVVALISLSACTPTEVAESRFQALAQTCYEFPSSKDAGAQTAFNAGLARPEGCDDPYLANFGGSGGTVAVGSSGSGGDASGTNAGGGASQNIEIPGGREGGADAGDGSAGSGGVNALPALSEACSALAAKRGFMGMTDDEGVILALFAAPVAVGGCQNDDGEGGCHEANSTTQLDLVTPGVVERLRGGANDGGDAEYECAEVERAQRTWITVGGDETTSFLWQKVNSDYFGEVLPEPPCGDSMPSEPGTVASLDATDRECILQWIKSVSAGGGS